MFRCGVLVVSPSSKIVRATHDRLWITRSPTRIHARPRSTLQDVHRFSEVEREAAALHGVPSGQTNVAQIASSAGGQAHLSQRDRNRPLPLNVQHSQRHQKEGNMKIIEGLGLPEHRRMGSMKRKAKPYSQQRPAQSLRTQQQHKAQVELRDAAFFGRTIHIPTSKDYPEVPKALFRSPKAYLHNNLNGIAQFQDAFAQTGPHTSRCTLTYHTAAHEIVVVGEGRSKKSAEDAAYLHFLARCHELNILAEVSDRHSSTNLMNREAVKKEMAEKKDAILDILNYAARYDMVPVIRTKRVIHKHRGQTRRLTETTVKLEEQGIHIQGHGSDSQASEMDAAVKFKPEAEKYHATQGSGAMIIKDSDTLTTDHTQRFVEFMGIVRPGIRIDLKTTQLGDTFVSQGLINSEPIGHELQMANKRIAETAALLAACIKLKKDDPALWPRYIRALQYGNGQILKPIAPLDMSVDEDCSLLMRETLLGARKAGLPDEVGNIAPSAPTGDTRRRTNLQLLGPTQTAHRSGWLRRKLEAFSNDPRYAEIRLKKADLPMSHFSAKVLDLVNNNDYSIIIGATGSGKTTQVPQILLESAINLGEGGTCNIICTQPRRIAATSVARRVAVERGEPLQETVGYIVRFDSKPPQPGGGICYCTTGILLQQLQHMPDEIMDNVTHLVIDEVHERDTSIDFLLILLKKNMLRRKLLHKRNPRVVLMSATMDTELFANYFKCDTSDGKSVACPSLSVPGRTFPVRERYIDEIMEDMRVANTPLNLLHSDPKTAKYMGVERDFQSQHKKDFPQIATSYNPEGVEDRSIIDWSKARHPSSDTGKGISGDGESALVPIGLVATTIAHIARTTDQGAILVFLPGLEEIVRLDVELTNSKLGVDLNDGTRFKRYMLHSSITSAHQSVFEPVAEECRKIILATNIAETSVTIPDVQHVIDSGKLREKQYDQDRRITMLACTWISKSNSKQRAGRAGRVQDGNYYALFSKERYDSLRAIGLPELLRSDLQETCLDIKAQAFKTPIREFLADAIEPPAPKSVDSSVYNLQALDALTEDEQITTLGRLLATLPVHPALGKMIILGIIFRCLDPMLILGAAVTERSLFIQPLAQRAEANAAKLSFVRGSASDHMALVNAVRELRHWRYTHGDAAMRQFAQSHYLHINAFNTIDSTCQQIETLLVEAGLIPYNPPYERQDSQYGDPALNENSYKTPLIKALNLAGLHPNLAVSPYGGMLLRTPGEKNTMIHPSSTNAPKDRGKWKKESNPHTATFYTYGTLARSNDGNSLFLRETTQITPLQACLFGGRLSQNEERTNVLEIDNWLPFYVLSHDRRALKTVLEFRKSLERLLMMTFNDLGNIAKQRKANKDAFQTQETYLADDEVRRSFAAGLVDVLDRDIAPGERSRQRGWASEQRADTFRPRQGPAPPASQHARELMDSIYRLNG